MFFPGYPLVAFRPLLWSNNLQGSWSEFLGSPVLEGTQVLSSECWLFIIKSTQVDRLASYSFCDSFQGLLSHRDVLHMCLSICVWSALCWWSFSKRVAFRWTSIVYFFSHLWASSATAPCPSPTAILSVELPPQSRCLCWLTWAPCLLTQQLNPNSPVNFPGLLQIQNCDLWATRLEQQEAKQSSWMVHLWMEEEGVSTSVGSFLRKHPVINWGNDNQPVGDWLFFKTSRYPTHLVHIIPRTRMSIMGWV